MFPLSMEATTTNTSGTLLGRMVQERLRQLGVSRRQFCISNNISRQTLYEIEHQGKVNLMPSSLVAIDKGCHWEPGTAARYAVGDTNVGSELSNEERVENYLRKIMERISLMTIDELERESIWLEEELFGRNSEDMAESITLIRDALGKIIPSLHMESRTVDGQGTTNPKRGKNP
jgi:hypothetical protein